MEEAKAPGTPGNAEQAPHESLYKQVAAIKQERRRIDELKPAEYNPRKRLRPGDEEYERLKRSIETFGYVDPIIINADGTVIGGHQRLFVLQDLGYQEADVAVVTLNKADEKALNIALNKISGEWDEEKLAAIFADLDVENYDLSLTGFSADEAQKIGAAIADSVQKEEDGPKDSGEWETKWPWDDRPSEYQEARQPAEVDFNNLSGMTSGEADGYAEFTEKFKPKKTTDDCYTPPNVYETIKDWVMEEYGIGEDRPIVRPFYPGGDYKNHKYPAGCVVIDNPPFSILSEILNFYNENGIDYFLFAPTLTLFNVDKPKCRYIINNCGIVYENGANVNTSFVTNLDEYKVRLSPELSRRIKETQQEARAERLKYEYPPNVITAARLTKLLSAGVELKIRPGQCTFIRELDAQKEYGKTLYGGGFLISDGAAAERIRAEQLAQEVKTQKQIEAIGEGVEFDSETMVWHLSEREREIIETLNKYDE